MTIHLIGKVDTREVTLNGVRLDPKPSQKKRNHSPDGFMWGYSGSGPAQLALAVLLACVPVDIALNNYQDFKSGVIATLDKDEDFDAHINLAPWLKPL